MGHIDLARWQAASVLLDEALDLPEAERAAWLAALRDKAPGLADTVRALLDEHEIVRQKQFLEEACLFGPGAAIDRTTLAGTAGRVFGAYRLASPIGRGGMGTVWLAERCDGLFNQRVAVKLLDLARSSRAEERFRREATFVARLTHPNIAHLIDAGVSAEGQPYLALELVDGQPIDEYCGQRGLDVPARIRLFLDALGAVSHAHSHRIIHRDIKPSNVFVRGDGLVKLLDFGIAKLLDQEGQAISASTLTLEHGLALTPGYAAPEQMSGGRVTPATDVYALGVLLYILLTGRHPYADASSPAELLKAVLEIPPPPPSSVDKTLKGDLETIVAKAMNKEPRDRYPSAAAMADDLRRYLSSEPIHARRDALSWRARRLARKYPGMAAAAVTVVALAALSAMYATRTTPATQPAPGQPPQNPIPLTSEAGDEQWPNLSPDQTHLAFSWVPRGSANGHIATKALATDAIVQLTDDTAHDASPVWSPDGQQLAFVRSVREPEHRWEICIVPATGGPARVLLDVTGLPAPGLAWWQAGNALLFPMRRASTEPFHLAALDLATLEVRPMTHPPPAPLLAAPGDSFPAVAADGRNVAFVRETHEGRDVFLLDLATRVERRLTRDRHQIFGLAWSADGQALIASSRRSGGAALYRIDVADGTIVPVPEIGEGASQPMTVGERLVYSQTQVDSNIYRLDLRGDRTPAPRAIIASSRPDAAPHISPDGRRIAFLSKRAGTQEIWIASADGTGQSRLTPLAVTSGPRWSPDGRLIGVGAVAPGVVRPDIWVLNVDGGTPRRLTEDPSYETILGWSADGAAVYFISDRTGGFEVWKVPTTGGPATRVTERGGLRAQESPDGRFLYYADDTPEVWRRGLGQTFQEELIKRFPPGTHWGGDWLVRGGGFYYLNEEAPSQPAIEYLPFTSAGGAARLVTLTAPPAHQVTVFDVAPDESWLVWAQDDYRSTDIMMVERRDWR